MERKLASVQRITAVEPIEGADKIELVKVLGWQCVTQKSNNFKVGDLCAYFEIDSLIPTQPPFEFLKKKPEDTEARLRTIRLKKQLSQGLVLPLNVCRLEGSHGSVRLVDRNTLVPDYNPAIPEWWIKPVNEGDDVSEFFGITKYEAPIPAQLRGKIKGQFPYFLIKTDETRIQSCPGVLTRNKGKKFYITEKIDGSSMTVYYYTKAQAEEYGLPIKPDQTEVFGICSRSLDLEQTEDNAYWKCALKYDILKNMQALDKPIAIQGEIFGEGIQGNKLKQPGLNFRVFNVYDLATKSYKGYNDFINIVNNLNLQTVPILTVNWELNHTVDQLVMWSIDKSSINTEVWREGIVFRTMEEDVDKDLGRFSFKVINPEFLLKHNE